MGVDPAHFWRNLYLSKCKCNILTQLNKPDIAVAGKFCDNFSFIDNLCTTAGSDDFERSHQGAHPKELELLVENFRPRAK